MRKLIKSINEGAKTIAFRYTSLGVPTYPYNLEPIQLALLINEIERLRNVKGCIVEIGVARGLTTRFLCQHIKAQGMDAYETLYAIDTFNSFLSEDLEYEIKRRGKSLSDLSGFAYNDFKTWKKNFSNFSFVKAIQAECSTVDYSALSPIKLAFLDVDLYLPTKRTLPLLYNSLVKGGALIVDDILNNSTYDGAYQAFTEFCASNEITSTIVGNKCGVIYKP